MGTYYFSDEEVPGSIQLSEKMDNLKQRLCTLVNRQDIQESLATRAFWHETLVKLEEVAAYDEEVLEQAKKSVDNSS